LDIQKQSPEQKIGQLQCTKKERQQLPALDSLYFFFGRQKKFGRIPSEKLSLVVAHVSVFFPRTPVMRLSLMLKHPMAVCYAET